MRKLMQMDEKIGNVRNLIKLLFYLLFHTQFVSLTPYFMNFNKNKFVLHNNCRWCKKVPENLILQSHIQLKFFHGLSS